MGVYVKQITTVAVSTLHIGWQHCSNISTTQLMQGAAAGEGENNIPEC